jgi:hypothetical protein
MSPKPTQTKTTKPPTPSIFDEPEEVMGATPTTDLAIVPEEARMQEAMEREYAVRARSLMARANMPSAEIDNILANRERILTGARGLAIKKSKPLDWTLWRGAVDGEVVATPRSSLMAVAKKVYGISIFNYRPVGRNGAEPEIVRTDEFILGNDGKPKEHNGQKIPVFTAKMWADGFCELTGETLPDQTYTARTGRFAGQELYLSDLTQSCRTGLDKLITTKLTGLAKVAGDELVAITGDPKFLERCYKGSGFGTSADRKAAALSDDDLKAAAKALGDDIMRRTGGDAAAAKDLLIEISSWTDKSGKKVRGFDSVARFTGAFQIENAKKALAIHPVFGDAARGASPAASPAGAREPGSEG